MKKDIFGVETEKPSIVSIIIQAVAAIVLFAIVLVACILTSMAAM